MVVAMWFPPVGTFGIVLAVLGFIVSIIEFKGWLRIILALGCVLLGIGEVISIVKADTTHDVEVKQQHADVENLRSDLHKSEIERQVAEAYLKAKLEDSYQMNAQLAQLGPALLKLAQTGAEFQKKQYEAKVTSDKELYDFTMGVVKKIRDFSSKYRQLEDKQASVLAISSRDPQLSDAERQRRWNDNTQKEIQLYYARDAEFHSTILSDALYAKNEMQKRGLPEPGMGQLPMAMSNVDMALRGILAGSYPELSLADYLELRAKEIPHK